MANVVSAKYLTAERARSTASEQWIDRQRQRGTPGIDLNSLMAHLRAPEPNISARALESAENAPPIFTTNHAGCLRKEPQVNMQVISASNASVDLTDEQRAKLVQELGISASDVSRWTDNAIWALAAWQHGRGLPPTGRLTKATLKIIGE